MGVVVIRALPFGVYIRAPGFWKLPRRGKIRVRAGGRGYCRGLHKYQYSVPFGSFQEFGGSCLGSLCLGCHYLGSMLGPLILEMLIFWFHIPII